MTISFYKRDGHCLAAVCSPNAVMARREARTVARELADDDVHVSRVEFVLDGRVAARCGLAELIHGQRVRAVVTC